MQPKMTDKQKRFVDEYLVDLNATKAAIRAGYSNRTARQIASQNLSKLDIQEAIQKGSIERNKKTQLKRSDVIEGLLIEARREGTGSSHQARIKAWEVLARHLDMFTEKQVKGESVSEMLRGNIFIQMQKEIQEEQEALRH